MKHTILLAESAAAPITESWPTFPPGGDKKNGHWIALAAYTDGPRGPKVAELREALTKKLSGKTAEAKRGSTTFKSPLLPKLREVFVRGAEIPGVSPNSMNENSDLLLYVVEFDTYMPKLFEIAEDVLEDLVLSKKDLYDWANGPVESGYSAVYSAAKQLRLDVDSVYSATDARQKRYMGEAVDPQAFGELRSLMAAPYRQVKMRKTWLRTVADRVSAMIRDAGKDEGAVDAIVTYADDVLGQISDQELLVIAPLDAQAINNKGLAKAQRLEPVAVALMKKHQLAIYSDGNTPLSVTPEEDAQDLLQLKIGSVKPASDDGSFRLITDGFSLVDRSDEARDIIAAVARGHKLLRLYVEGSVTFTSLTGTLKNLAEITPTGAELVAEVKVTGWDVARRRTGLDPIPALMARLEQPRDRISGTGGRLTVILTFERYVMDSRDAEELEAAVEAGIIRDFGPASYQDMVSITFN